MADDPNTIAPLDDDSKVVLEDAAPPPASEEAPADPKPAEPGEGVSPEPEPPAEPPKAEAEPVQSAREKLISKLIGEEESPKPEETEVEPATAEETPKPPKAEEPPKAPEPPKDDDLKEVTNEDIKALKPGEARRKITRLITRVRESEPMAQGYKEIVDLCQKNGISPDDYKAWVALGVGIQQGNEAAVKDFASLAEKLGITAPVQAPAITPDLDAWLAAQTKDLEISATAAAELRKRLGAAPPAPAAATPAPTPAPRQAAPQPRQPVVDPVIAARTAATTEIGRIADEYEKRIGVDNFKALEPRVMAELAKRKGKHPDAWADIYRVVVESELAKAPKLAQIQSTLRPRTGQAPPATPEFKTERERLIHKYAG
jgi:hypothetical protein